LRQRQSPPPGTRCCPRRAWCLFQATCLRGTPALASGDLGQAEHVPRAGHLPTTTCPSFHRRVLELPPGWCLAPQRRDAAIDAVHAAPRPLQRTPGSSVHRSQGLGTCRFEPAARPAGNPSLPGLTSQELPNDATGGIRDVQPRQQPSCSSAKTVEYTSPMPIELGIHSCHWLAALLCDQEDPGAYLGKNPVKPRMPARQANP
jgi:hypothetical protein